MPSNVVLNTGTGGSTLTTKQRTHDGDTTQSQSITIAGVTGTEDAYTFEDIGGDAANGLDVDVTRLPALAAGTNNIGDVDVLTLPALVAGTANIGDVDVLTLPALVAGTANIGDVDVLTVPAPLSTTGAGTEATALRVTLANDSTGVVSVDDNGGSLTVDNAALAVTGTGVEAGALRVTLATDSTGVVSVDDNAGSLTVDGTVTANLAAGTNNIGDVDVLTIAAGDNNIGNVDIVTLPALAAGTNNIGDVDVLSIAAGTNSVGNVGLIGRTTGGMSTFRSIDLDETEEEVKATAGQVFSIAAFNTTAAPLYLKFYNATAATVVVGTTTPTHTFVVPGNADSDGAGFIWNNAIGFAFGTAITVACTTGVADADVGAPGANACIVNIGFV